MQTKTEIEKAKQLLNVLEMREPRARIENLIKLVCVQEISRCSSFDC